MQTYNTKEAIPRYTIVMPGDTNGEVKISTSSNSLIKGITGDVDVKAGNVVDVNHFGVAKVVCGETIKDGEPFTSNTKGQAIKAKDGDTICGIMLEDGELNQYAQCLIAITHFIKETTPNSQEGEE